MEYYGTLADLQLILIMHSHLGIKVLFSLVSLPPIVLQLSNLWLFPLVAFGH